MELVGEVAQHPGGRLDMGHKDAGGLAGRDHRVETASDLLKIGVPSALGDDSRSLRRCVANAGSMFLSAARSAGLVLIRWSQRRDFEWCSLIAGKNSWSYS